MSDKNFDLLSDGPKKARPAEPNWEQRLIEDVKEIVTNNGDDWNGFNYKLTPSGALIARREINNPGRDSFFGPTFEFYEVNISVSKVVDLP